MRSRRRVVCSSPARRGTATSGPAAASATGGTSSSITSRRAAAARVRPARAKLRIHNRPLFPAGKVMEGAEGIDIAPTIADALGVATDPEWQGASLIPVANGLGGYPQLSFSSQYESFHAGRIGTWKAKLMGTGAPHVYNLAKDPDERKDLSGQAAAAIPARMVIDPMWMLRQWN